MGPVGAPDNGGCPDGAGDAYSRFTSPRGEHTISLEYNIDIKHRLFSPISQFLSAFFLAEGEAFGFGAATGSEACLRMYIDMREAF